MSIHKEVKRITTLTLQKMKAAGEKIAMITAYDFSFGRLFDGAGVDVILVGDSASNVMAGHETTLPITLDQMIYHACSVIRGINRCLVVVDLPFGSYQSNSEIALASAIRIMKETGAHAVKLEGGEEGILAMAPLRGRTPSEFVLDSYRALFIKHREEFGLTWNVALEAGGVMVADRIDIEIEVELLAAKPVQA